MIGQGFDESNPYIMLEWKFGGFLQYRHVIRRWCFSGAKLNVKMRIGIVQITCLSLSRIQNRPPDLALAGAGAVGGRRKNRKR